MGSFCSVIMFLIVLAYAYQKTDVWLTKKDISIQYSTYEAFYTSDDVFDNEQGLNFALAFTAYDEETEPILDESYGRIVFNSYQWGSNDEDGNFIPSEVKEIKTHTCTREELGIEGGEDNSAFLPIEDSNLVHVSNYQKKFHCIDREEMRLYGDFNSAKARILNFQLVRCHDGGYFAKNGVTCKSEPETTEFLRNKFFTILYNQKRFA